jgi:hypothetical protein
MSKRAPLSFKTDSVSPVSTTRLSANAQTDTHDNEQTSKRTNNAAAIHANDQTKKSRAGRQFIAAHVLPEAAKQFKLLAVQTDKTAQALLIEAINDLFAKHGLSRIAD